MLSIATLPVLLKIISKIDLKPIILKIKDIDFNINSENEVEKQKEEYGKLALEIIAELTPQLGKIADDLPDLVAIYKKISLEEAKDLDAIEVIKEIMSDDGILVFFKTALQKNVEQIV